jgi:hypothetical protein
METLLWIFGIIVLWAFIAGIWAVVQALGASVAVQLPLQRLYTALPLSPLDLVNARITLTRRIKLGTTLLNFYDRIKTYPRCYASSQTHPDVRRRMEETIPSESIAEVPMSELVTLGITAPEKPAPGAYSWECDASLHWTLGTVPKCLVLNFMAGQKEYAFCAYADHAPDWLSDVYPDQSHGALRVHVVELPAKGVLEMLLAHAREAWTDKLTHEVEEVECFRPGAWIRALYGIAARLDAPRVQDKKAAAQFDKTVAQLHADRAKKFT